MRSSILRDREAVTLAVQSALSMKEAIEALGLRAAGGNYQGLLRACEEFDLTPPRASGKYKTAKASETNRIPDEILFVENSTYSNRFHIKNRLFRLGIPNACSICGLGPEWNGKPITLQLDHINGIYNDHRIENLRILCPNCHSQTSTFCGGNK